MPDSTPVSGELSRATPEVQKYRPRACQSCARSKMRCVWLSEPGATPCQRCAKIKAPCTLPEINPRRRRGPSTRVGQLEEKIDGIMSLLNASQQIQQNSPSSSGQTPPPPNVAAGPFPGPEQSRNSIQQLLNPNVEPNVPEGSGNERSEGMSSPPPSSHYHTNARLVPPAGLVPPASIAGGAVANPNHTSPRLTTDREVRPATTTTTVVESVEIFRGFRVTFLEADRALNLYRSIYAPSFPFVTIPVMLSSYDLYEKAPFLFRTIVAVTMPQGPMMQAEFKMWFREYVAQHVVINNEARLEILQAILVHLAWGDYYFMVTTQATTLIQLAMGLVIDLGLNRWPSEATSVLMKNVAAHLGNGPWRKKHTLEEMRAALGAFYVTSLCSTLFRRHHPMNYNSYLLKCCESLEQTQEYDSDRFLVAVVKMQQILTRGADIIAHSDDGGGVRRIHYTPLHMALSSMQREMETLIREQPADVECNALLWTHFHANVCRLYEPVIYIRSTSSTGYDPSEATARTSALWQCLHSAREFFSAYLSIPPQHLICVPFHTTHLSFCLVTIVRLLFLGGDDSTQGSNVRGDPDWNPTLARQSVDFETICLRVSDLFDEADKISASLGGRRARYLDQERSTMGIHRDKVRWIRSWYAGRIHQGTYPFADGSHETAQRRSAGGGGNLTIVKDGSEGEAQAPGDQPMDVDYGDQQAHYAVPGELDDGFWQAMFDWGCNGPLEAVNVQ